jgi:hypothetical protein
VSLWWSFLLTVIGSAGYLLVVRGIWWGLLVGLLVQLLWAAYAVATRQWWFLVSASLYSGVNVLGLVRRRQVPTEDPPP